MKQVIFVFLCLLMYDARAQNPRLLRNPITQRSWGGGGFEFTEFGDKTIFMGRDIPHGVELWITDGSAEGTRLVKDIKPGHDDSRPGMFTAFKDKMYFCAADSPGGRNRLWVTDGSEEGTRMIKNIIPELSNRKFQVYKDKLYLNAYGPVEYDYQLWASDGTEEGTLQFTDFTKGVKSLTVFRDRLYFVNATTFDEQFLWSSDGTKEGTQKLSDSVRDIQKVDGKLFCWMADNDGLLVIDSAGVQERLDVRFMSDDDMQKSLVAFKGKVYFPAYDADDQTQLWVTDGTAAGTHMVKQIISNRLDNIQNEFVVFKNKVLFRVYKESSGWEIWQTDGTESGTRLFLKTTTPPDHLTVYNKRLYFRSDYQLWEVEDNAASAHILQPDDFTKNDTKSVNGPLLSTSNLYICNGSMYFSADYVSYFMIGTEIYSVGFDTYILKKAAPGLDISPAIKPAAKPGLDLGALAGTDTATTFLVTPNPASDKLTISNKYPIRGLRIKDMDGKVVYDEPELNTLIFSINTSAFKNGLYFVIATTEKGVQTFKIQIVH